MDVRTWTYIFVGGSFGLYLLIAWLTRVRDTEGFYVAGRGVPTVANGIATAADWMSAASVISMAGMISALGYTGGMYLMGWTGGYVLLALLLAPYLRKFGHFTVPDFVGDRYSSNVARLVAVICAIFVSFTYVAGQMKGVGVVFSRFLDVELATGVIIGMIIVFLYATLGGMKGITWTQVAQYWVLITAFLIPAIAISIKLTGHAIPQVGLAGDIAGPGGEPIPLIARLNAINEDLGFASYTAPFLGGWNKLNVFCTTLALMAGTAGLPHVIVRFYTVKNVRAARWSAFWALLFISLLYLTAPATAAFARYYMVESIQGKTAAELPSWFENWQKTGLILWLDNGDGKLRYAQGEGNEVFNKGPIPAGSSLDWNTLLQQHGQWVASKGKQGADARKALRDDPAVDDRTYAKIASPDLDIIVLATPEMAELASWIIALMAAGCLAAALSTASGLLLVISSSVAHDLYYRLVNPEASEAKRLVVGRTVIGLAVVVAGIFGIYPPGFVSEVVAFAFGLAASSFFPAIVLGIFSRRVGTVPAVAGMVAGIAFTASYIVGGVYFDMPLWCFGIKPQGIGTIGMLVNFVVTLGLTPLCKAPTPEVQELVRAIREPEGASPAVAIETTPVATPH